MSSFSQGRHMDDQRAIWNALDACRGSDLRAETAAEGSSAEDLDDRRLLEQAAEQVENDPAIQAIWQRSLRLDEQISAAFHDEMAIPSGLQDRLLQSLDETHPESDETDRDVDESAQVSRPESAGQGGAQRLLRRSFIAAGLAAAIVLAFTWWLPSSKSLSEEQLASQTLAWTQSLPADWQSSPAPASHPLPANVITGSATPWQTVGENSLDSSAVAYDLSPDRSGRTILYVIRTDREISLSTVSPQPLNATGGYSIGAWKRDELIYVIVHRGPQRELQTFTIKPPIV